MKKEWYLATIFTIVLAIIVSCGDIASVYGPQGPQGPTGPQGPAATPASLTDIQQLVADENAYRSTVGQEQLVPGLDCTLYSVPNTTTQIVGATLTNIGSFGYTGVFNQPNVNTTAGLNVLPAGLKSVYQNWYILKCTGDYVVADSNWHSFSLTSDDGANLSLDGALINDDGLHGAATVSNSKFLKYGIHSFELDYLQGQGQEALILNLDGSVLDNTHFYH